VVVYEDDQKRRLSALSMAYKAFSAVPVSIIGGHYIFDLVIAAGKSLDLNLDELENADGITREMTRPYDLSMYLFATLIVRVHYGFFCQDAINTPLLARRVSLDLVGRS